MKPLQIYYHPIDDLRLRPTNPRTHTAKQIDQIARSIERFGFVNPILMDNDEYIIAGHGRYLAARKLGMLQVPAIRLSELTEEEVRAYVIADTLRSFQSLRPMPPAWPQNSVRCAHKTLKKSFFFAIRTLACEKKRVRGLRSAVRLT